MRKKKEEKEFEVVVTQELEPHELKKTLYIGYHTRLFMTILLFVSFLGFGVYYLLESIHFKKEENIHYQENSDLDYRVYLKENEFYETDYLGKNMLYIASLIDRIDIDFEYLFTIEEESKMDFQYGIVGKLIIADDTGENTYFEKEYKLLEDKKISMKDEKVKQIKESISIDYDYYNNLANDFKMAYAVDTNSYLKVYLEVEKNNSEEEKKFEIKDQEELSITIPLSEKSINIKMDYTNLNEAKQVVSQRGLDVKDKTGIVVSTILLLGSILMFVKMIQLLFLLRVRKTAFDKYIHKILTEYDRLVVETMSCPKLTENNVIKIKKFEELLDVRDNLKLPIMYYSLIKHQKAYFYIKHETDIFLLTVKAVDLEK